MVMPREGLAAPALGPVFYCGGGFALIGVKQQRHCDAPRFPQDCSTSGLIQVNVAGRGSSSHVVSQG